MRILSIDFDAIMFPCIRLYNENCAGKESDTQIWNMLEDRYGISQFLSYDANLYKNIATLVAKNVEAGATFIPIQEHDELVQYLKDHELVQEDMEIVNLDYHHDIMYHRESIAEMVDFDEWNCANWFGYLLFKNSNNIGTWVRCPGSDMYHPEYSGHDFGERFVVKNLKDLPEILNIKFDYVFLCLSPQWVPHCYHHLYDVIVETVLTFTPKLVVEPVSSNIVQFNPTFIEEGTYDPDAEIGVEKKILKEDTEQYD